MNNGVTRIDGHYVAAMTWQHLSEKARTTISALLAPGTAAWQSISYVNWAQVPEWINNVLDDHWEVKYGHVTAGNATANAFWHLEKHGAEGVTPLMVDVHVESVIAASGGALDMTRSADAVRNRVACIVTSTARDPEEVWVGRFVIITAYMLIDIRGMSSNDALQGYARKLLEHTVNRNRTPLTVPVILRGPIKTRGDFAVTSSLESSANKITVEGINNWFSIHFELANSIAAAYATPEGTGILFDKCAIKKGQDANATVVDFTFFTREMGSYVVNIHFAGGLTMVSVSQIVEIDIV